jgi:ribose transport system ATP-binding protein
VALSLVGVSKTFPGTVALDDVSVEIAEQAIHALVGHNGSGKSTLIKILSGYQSPDPGATCFVDGEEWELRENSPVRGVTFVHQDLALIDGLSVVDNLMLGQHVGRSWLLERERERDVARELIEMTGHELDVRRRVGDLTPAERTIVAIARALRGQGEAPRYMVLDEPTATMPASEVARLFECLRAVQRRGTGLLYVSHRLQETLDLADVVTVLRDGRVVGTYSTDELDARRLADLIIGDAVTKSMPVAASVTERRATTDAREPALAVDALSGGNVLSVDLTVASGEVVGVAGVEGSGMESLLPLIFGSQPRESGEVLLGATRLRGTIGDSIRSGLVMLPSGRLKEGVFRTLTLAENMHILQEPSGRMGLRVVHGRERSDTESWIRRLQIRPADPRALLALASGGNQQKVLLARAMQLRPKVLLVNEPTQGVDVGASGEILRLLRDLASQGLSVLVASTNLEELIAMCDRIVVMNDGLITDTLSAGASLNDLARAVLGRGSADLAPALHAT